MYPINIRPTFPSTKESRRNEYIIFILIAVYVLLIQFNFIFDMYGIMELSYINYNNNKSDYISVSALVKEKQPYRIYVSLHPPYGIPTYTFNNLLISYQLDGIEHNIWTKLYPEYEKGDKIQIAVNKTNHMKIQRIQSYSIKNIPFIVWLICIIIWILYFCGLFRVIMLYKKEYKGLAEFDLIKPTYIEQQKYNEKNYRLEQEKTIKNFVKKNEIHHEGLNVNAIKNNLLLNKASEWYVDEGVSIGDIILLKNDNEESLCMVETEYLRKNGLPDDYYVIAVKNTYWLCCHAEEECIYAFSKTLGLTHTKYQSLYDYIIETCNIPFN